MSAHALFHGLTGTRASQHLNMVRGLAAIAVLLYHVRYRLFVDYADVPAGTPFASAWYAMTAFGHDAVIVFFVLSGLLIGAPVAEAVRRHRFDWRAYTTNRLVRLYLVVIPGLLLTLFWDQLGAWWFPESDIYTAAATGYRHDYFDVAARSGVDTFFGNLLFLQTLIVAPFGSNDALWSLAFEFWYYLSFPLLLAAILGWRRRAAGIACLLLGAAALLVMGGTMRSYMLFWLAGAAVGLLPNLSRPALSSRTIVAAAGIGVVLTVAAAHSGPWRALFGPSVMLADAVTALVFAGWMYVALHDRRPAAGDAYGLIGQRLADCSFTLYVAHLPVLVWLRAWLAPGRPWDPTPAAIAIGLLIAGSVLVYSAALARMTEAHTDRVRHWVQERWSVRPWSRAAPVSVERA
jgi:peptidoglycan/LPS O-acetylase OafA/YrhL